MVKKIANLIPFPGGDKEVYTILYEKFHKELVQYCINKGFTREEAEDIAADVFEKLWRLKKNFKSLKHVRNYLFVALRNTIKNKKRDITRKGSTPLSIERVDLTHLEDTNSFSSDNLHKKLISEELVRIMQELPEQAGKVAQLRILYDLETNEIAQTLGISPDTVRKHFENIKKKLIEEFNKRGLGPLSVILYLCTLFF
jgi:RNA polymerase sigma-70 factor (ECF subfamily)